MFEAQLEKMMSGGFAEEIKEQIEIQKVSFLFSWLSFVLFFSIFCIISFLFSFIFFSFFLELV